MLENKYINTIIITLMAAAVLFSSVLVVFPQDPSITTLSKTDAEYENLLFDKNKVSEINIEMKQEDWDWIIENATQEEYRGANITINGETFYNVGIRPKGNSSLTSIARDDTTNRYSFKIKFDKYIHGQTYHGLDEMVINNMMSDATYMKEYLSYDLFKKMGIVTPLYAFSNIKINNEPWGLYLAVEVTEESFLNRNFGRDYGNLYRPESTGSSLKWVDENHSNYQGIKDNAQTKITDEDFDKVVEMIRNLNSGIDLETYLDVDEILKYFAVNTLLVNQDSYVGNFNHNYLLYEEDGVFSILPWDLNMSFAGFQTRGAQQAVDLSIDAPYNGNAENYPLISKLLEVPEYKKIYYKYLEEAVTLYFDSGLFRVTVDHLDSLINEYVKNDATAFYTYDQYTAALPVLKEFGKLRSKSVLAQLAGETTAGTVNLDLNALGSMGGGGIGNRPEGMGGRPGDIGRRPENMEIRPDGMGSPPNNMEIRPDGMGSPPNNMDGIPNNRVLPDDMGPGNEFFPIDMQGENREGANWFPGGDMRQDKGRMNPNNSKNLIPSLIITGICALIMIAAIFFVYRFKRYQYQNGLGK